MEKDINTTFLVYQAKSFYNAYIALDQINRQCEEPMLYYIPMLVNGAFSVEITLKAILAKNQIDYGKEHNLLILFEKLPDSFKAEMLEHLIEKAPEYEDIEKWSEELILISNAFVDWRYFYEEKTPPAFDARFLSAFANAAIWTMFSHNNAKMVYDTDETITNEEFEEKLQQNRETSIRTILNIIQKKDSVNGNI